MMEVLKRFNAFPIEELSKKSLCNLADEATEYTKALLEMERNAKSELRQSGATRQTVSPRPCAAGNPGNGTFP